MLAAAAAAAVLTLCALRDFIFKKRYFINSKSNTFRIDIFYRGAKFLFFLFSYFEISLSSLNFVFRFVSMNDVAKILPL